MYINFNVLKRHKLNAHSLLLIQGFKQSSTPEEREVFRPYEELAERLIERGYLERIKGKKGEDEFLKIRTSKKGKAFLRDLEVADITEESKELARQLYVLFTERELRVGSKKQLVELVSWFRNEVDFSDAQILGCVEDFVNQNPDTQWMLNNLIWKKPNSYSTKYSLSNSELYRMLTK